jgi:hypothetical protein
LRIRIHGGDRRPIRERDWDIQRNSDSGNAGSADDWGVGNRNVDGGAIVESVL